MSKRVFSLFFDIFLSQKKEGQTEPFLFVLQHSQRVRLGGFPPVLGETQKETRFFLGKRGWGTLKKKYGYF